MINAQTLSNKGETPVKPSFLNKTYTPQETQGTPPVSSPPKSTPLTRESNFQISITFFSPAPLNSTQMEPDSMHLLTPGSFTHSYVCETHVIQHNSSLAFTAV